MENPPPPPEFDRCYQGHTLDLMRGWPAEIVQTCVTSPPYYGLRDYGGIPPVAWPEVEFKILPMLPPIRIEAMDCVLGLEPSPEAFLGHMVHIFREVHRLLKKDGTCWINLGDTYFSDGGHSDGDSVDRRGQFLIGRRPAENYRPFRNRKAKGLNMGMKAKDAQLMPHTLALCLRADGWYVRNDIVWAKPNVLPESVKDRCTKTHEYLFLLAKREKYFYDAEAIKEPITEPEEATPADAARAFSRKRVAHPGGQQRAVKEEGGPTDRTMKNKRTVWRVAPVPTEGVHFATFPPKLVEPCVLAGSRPGDVVFDPFMGSGTTAQVAQATGRRWLGCEIQTEYFPLQAKRTQKIGLL